MGTASPEKDRTEFTYHRVTGEDIYTVGETSRNIDGSSETETSFSGTNRVERYLVEIGQSWENKYVQNTTYRSSVPGVGVFEEWERIEMESETWTVTEMRYDPITVPAGYCDDTVKVVFAVTASGTVTDAHDSYSFDTLMYFAWWISSDGGIVKQVIDTGMGVGMNELIRFE